MKFVTGSSCSVESQSKDNYSGEFDTNSFLGSNWISEGLSLKLLMKYKLIRALANASPEKIFLKRSLFEGRMTKCGRVGKGEHDMG